MAERVKKHIAEDSESKKVADCDGRVKGTQSRLKKEKTHRKIGGGGKIDRETIEQEGCEEVKSRWGGEKRQPQKREKTCAGGRGWRTKAKSY